MKTFKDIRTKAPTWLDIGHDAPFDKNKLWWISDGKFEFRDDVYRDTSHHIYWEDEGLEGADFWGRIDHNKEMISIQANRNLMNREIKSKNIIKLLKKKLSKIKSYKAYYYSNKPPMLLDESTKTLASRYKYYTDLGHGDGKITLWHYNGNRLRYSDVTGTDLTHDDVFQTHRSVSKEIFGRIDHKNQVISAYMIHSRLLNKADVFDVLYDLRKKYKGYKILQYGITNRLIGLFESTTTQKTWKQYRFDGTYLDILISVIHPQNPNSGTQIIIAINCLSENKKTSYHQNFK